MPEINKHRDFPSVQLTEGRIAVSMTPDQITYYDQKPYPKPFIEWQIKARLQMFHRLNQAGAASVRSQPAHLPVLATLGEGEFPINLASRGIGLLPKDTLLEKFAERLNTVKEETSGQNWEESLPARVEAIRQFYENIDNIDSMLLGGLEIFEGKTADNARAHPFVSLLFTGEPPQFPSYQFNCIVEFLPPEDTRFKFLLAARELFAFDAFHVLQSRYAFGYAYHVIDILEKTPYTRR